VAAEKFTLDTALLAPHTATDCGFSGRPPPENYFVNGAAAAVVRAKKIANADKWSGIVCIHCKAREILNKSCPMKPDERNTNASLVWRSAHDISHFSAVLDQHYPQTVMFGLYECSRVSSESDDEDALRFARGSSTR
jgi:hypothetical protein